MVDKDGSTDGDRRQLECCGTAHSACLGGVVVTLSTLSEFYTERSFFFLSADWIFCWNSPAQNAGLDLDWI